MRNVPLIYAEEYAKPISQKLKCTVRWGKFDEYASDVNNHKIISDDFCELSNVKDVKDSEDAINDTKVPKKPFATFENRFWTLSPGNEMPLVVDNGGKLLINGVNTVGNGWVGKSFSQENTSRFAINPKLMITFTPSVADNIAGASLEGIKISFCKSKNEYAKKFQVKFFGAEAGVEDSIAYENNTSAECVLILPDSVRNLPLTKIEIMVSEWCMPDRRVRIEEITFGLLQEMGADTLISVEEHRVVNQIGSAVPLSTLEFVVMDKSDFFAEASDTGSSAVATGQPIRLTWYQQTKDLVSGSVDEIEIAGGEYYLKSWQDTGVRSQYKITAETLLSFMDMPYFRGTTYPEGRAASEVIQDVLGAAFPLGNDYNGHWEIDPVCAGVKVKNPIPLKLDGKLCTCKDALMLLAQVCGCVVDVYDGDDLDKSGFITVKPLRDEARSRGIGQNAANISLSKIYLTPPRAELKSPLKGVVCNLYGLSYEEKNKEVLVAKFRLAASAQKQDVTFALSDQVKDDDCTVLKNGNAYSDYEKIELNRPDGMVTLRFPALAAETDFEISVRGFPLVWNSSEYANKAFLKNGEIVAVQNPLVDNDKIADEIIAATESELKYREEYAIEMKRDLRLQVQDTLSFDKKPANAAPRAVVSGEKARVLEIQRSLTSVRQKVRLRKISS